MRHEDDVPLRRREWGESPPRRKAFPPRHGLEAVAIVAVISAGSGTAWLPEGGCQVYYRALREF